MSKEPFINQEISYINFYGERKLSTVSNFIKYVFSINEIENKNGHICYNTKTPIELFSNKLTMSIYGLNILNSPRKMDHPNYTSFQKTQPSWVTYLTIISRKH